MAFPTGFALGHKDHLFFFNKNGKVKKTELKSLSGKLWKIPLVRGIGLLWWMLTTVSKSIGWWAIAWWVYILMPVWASLIAVNIPQAKTPMTNISLVLIGIGLLLEVLMKFKTTKTIYKTIKELFTWHSMEHKTFAALLKGLAPTMQNIALQKKEQPECGSTMFVYLIIATLGLRAFIGNSWGLYDQYMVFIVFPIVYELHSLNKSKGWNWYSFPGYILQKIFFTREPIGKQYYKVGVIAMKKMLSEEAKYEKSK